LSCPSLDGDNDAEVLTKAGDIKQDGITNLARSVPFHDNDGSDSGTASILFVRCLSYIHDIHIFLQIDMCVRDDILKSDDHFGSAITTVGDLNNRRVVDLAIGAPLMKAVA
jgi:hypothetical protein